MNDPVPQRAAVVSLGSFERARNTDELALDGIARDPDRGVAVAADVDEGKVRREIGIR